MVTFFTKFLKQASGAKDTEKWAISDPKLHSSESFTPSLESLRSSSTWVSMGINIPIIVVAIMMKQETNNDISKGNNSLAFNISTAHTQTPVG